MALQSVSRVVPHTLQPQTSLSFGTCPTVAEPRPVPFRTDVKREETRFYCLFTDLVLPVLSLAVATAAYSNGGSALRALRCHLFTQNCIATHECNGIDIIIALILNDINPLGKKRMDLVLELKVSVDAGPSSAQIQFSHCGEVNVHMFSDSFVDLCSSVFV